MRNSLIILSIVHGISLFLSPGFILISGFAFDDPKSAKSRGLWLCFLMLLSWPISLLVALIGGWMTYRFGLQSWSIKLMLIPFINVFLFLIGLIWAIQYFMIQSK